VSPPHRALRGIGVATGFAALALLLVFPAFAKAAEPIPGPINARVVSVYDGDTFTANAAPWPGVTIRTAVRVDGVDTPGIRGECQAEKDMAIEARDFAAAALGDDVQLVDVRHGKYAGRVVARVLVDGQDLAGLIIGAGLGRPYDGRAREGWCDR
jgi:micrococcal nuclease